MVPDRQKVRTDGRTDDAKTISLRLRQIKNCWGLVFGPGFVVLYLASFIVSQSCRWVENWLRNCLLVVMWLLVFLICYSLYSV